MKPVWRTETLPTADAAPEFLDRSSITIWDIIPDIHGQAAKLERLLSALGYSETHSLGGAARAWRHPDPSRKAIFLGDFIDRGPGQARVLDIARRMIREGEALAVMGNHELNALHYATRHPETGVPLRARSPKNTEQHRAFLDAFPLGSRAAGDMFAWLLTLPLFLDLKSFRVAHACWAEDAIAGIRAATTTGVLDGDLLIRAADNKDPFGAAVDITAKGPEADMPVGCSFVDRTGVVRTRTRVAWWNARAKTWREVAASMPDPDACLPDSPASAEALALTYPPEAPPVFVGHYWLRGEVAPQSHNVFCLDYSAGGDGPLVSYAQPGGRAERARGFDLARLTLSGV